jgi:molybdopterin synthase catalytic subunit
MGIELTDQPIDYARLVEASRDASCGAVVLFLGTVRELSEGREVRGLDYEAFGPMAERKLEEVVVAAEARFPIRGTKVVHRTGRLELGEIAVAVVTASAHRAEAFDAARWIMDQIKRVVPIWKREDWAEGTPEWVHPSGLAPGAAGFSSGGGAGPAS